MAAFQSQLDRRRHERSAAERHRETRPGIAGLNLAPAYTDGVVTLRPQGADDLDADLAAKDDEQINWLWRPGERELWQAMTPDEQRAHVARLLAANSYSFGRGTKWCFAVDSNDARYVAYVDFDLANEHVPAGEANISYSSHPAHRGRGYVTRAVRLVARFIAQNTDARRAHLIVDSENTASLRVARAVGAVETGRWVNERGRTLIRHEIEIQPRTEAIAAS